LPYYFVFDTVGVQVALKYALSIRAGLDAFNRATPDMPIRLRMVLAFGDVELVDDQFLSEAFIEADRFISHPGFKKHAAASPNPAPLAATSLFHLHLGTDLANKTEVEELKGLPWSPVRVTDKHGTHYNGWVLGPAWIDEPEPAVVKEPEPFRILILVAHSVANPLYEAVELAKRAARDIKRSSRSTIRLLGAWLTSSACWSCPTLLRTSASSGCSGSTATRGMASPPCSASMQSTYVTPASRRKAIRYGCCMPTAIFEGTSSAMLKST